MKDIIMYGHSGSGNHGCEANIRTYYQCADADNVQLD